LLLPLFAVIAIGCGPRSIQVEQPDTGPADAVKRDLEMVVQNGQLGSEMTVIQDNLEKMKATDSAKAAELLQDLEEMYSLSDPEAVKKKANEMIGKLTGTPEEPPAEETPP